MNMEATAGGTSILSENKNIIAWQREGFNLCLQESTRGCRVEREYNVNS